MLIDPSIARFTASWACLLSAMNSKRPLEAISLRQPKNLQTTELKKLPYVKESKDEDWPDEMDFKVERWQRASEKEINTSRDQSNQQAQSKSRNLPSSR